MLQDIPQDIEVKYSEATDDQETSEQQDEMEKKSKPVRKRKKKDRKKSRKELEKVIYTHTVYIFYLKLCY